jgi:signal peptidase II
MKGRWVFLIIIGILLADQVLKIYIKTNFYLGEEHRIAGKWFRLHFVENVGMAWGWEFGSSFGKVILTLFRLTAVIFGVFYLRSIIQKKYHTGFIVCASLIYAGALGNLIDSMFYGMIFSDSNNLAPARLFPAGGGYSSFLHGKVVDMIYLPVIRGKNFEFFNMVFNIADASISIGIITLLIWHRKFFPKETPAPVAEVVVADESKPL